MRHFMAAHQNGLTAFLIKPFPLQFEGGAQARERKATRHGRHATDMLKEGATQRLERHYAKLGFVPCSAHPEFMYFDAGVILPEAEDLPHRRQRPCVSGKA